MFDTNVRHLFPSTLSLHLQAPLTGSQFGVFLWDPATKHSQDAQP